MSAFIIKINWFCAHAVWSELQGYPFSLLYETLVIYTCVPLDLLLVGQAERHFPHQLETYNPYNPKIQN